MATEEEIIKRIYREAYVTPIENHVRLLQEYANQFRVEPSPEQDAVRNNLEQALHLATLATDQQAEIERLKGLIASKDGILLEVEPEQDIPMMLAGGNTLKEKLAWAAKEIERLKDQTKPSILGG